MADAIKFWLAKAAVDVLIFLGICAAFLVVIAYLHFAEWRQQRRKNG